jgi:hypothetical protein
VKTLLLISIVATLFIAIAIVLASLELRNFEPIATSLYLQLIAVLGLRNYRIDNINFEVYKEEPLAS